MTKIRIIPVKKTEKLEDVKPPKDADSQKFPDEDYEKAYKYSVSLIKKFYDKQIEKAFKEILSFWKNFITFDDFARYVIYKIEEHTTLPEEIKYKLLKRLEALYKKTQAKTLPEIKPQLEQPDIRTMQFIDSLNDIYLGKFFKADQNLRIQILNWMKTYYLENGNPIGRNQTGIEEFLNKFGQFLKVKTDWKARQIIDTTINFVRNAAAINAYQKANIEEFVWDAVNDRLTCPACRSMDGRVIRTETAIAQLEEVINQGLTARPVLTVPFKDKTEKSPVKFPPLHPNCRCGTYAHFKEEEIQFSVQRPQFLNKYWDKIAPQQELLEKEFKDLTNDEIYYRVKAHEGSSWIRMSKGNIDLEKNNLKYHYKKRGVKLGLKSMEEYEKLTKDIIEKAENIYVQRLTDGETDYIFKKGKYLVISNDDYLYIKSMYILDRETIEDRIKSRAELGHGTIQIK